MGGITGGRGAGDVSGRFPVKLDSAGDQFSVVSSIVPKRGTSSGLPIRDIICAPCIKPGDGTTRDINDAALAATRAARDIDDGGTLVVVVVVVLAPTFPPPMST